MTESNFHPAAEADVGYGQLFSILVRRGLWFVGAFTCALAASAFATLTEEPTYQSSMQLLVEPNYQEQLKQNDLESPTSERPSKTDYVTQLNLMRSNQFLQKAVDSLKSDYPDLTVESVQNSLSLFQVKEGDTETRIFEAAYLDSDPVKTQKILEALKTVYLEYNVAQQQQRLKRGLSFINQQLQSARQNLQESQGALEQFRRGENVIDPTLQATAVTDALNRTEQQQQELQAQLQDVQARYGALQQQLSLTPQSALIASRLSQSSRYQTLLNELQKTELELARQQVILTDLDPLVQSLMDQRQNQLDLLRQEIQRVLGRLPAELNTSGENLLTAGQLSEVDLSLVAALVEAQANLRSLEARRQSLAQTEQQFRAELNRFPGLMAEYDRLQPEVDIERAVLQQLLEERERLSAELARGGYNWQVVELPQTGEKIAPNPVKNLMLGAVAGLFLGAVAAFAREALDGVVHTSDDLEKQVPLPLLGMLPELPMSEADKLVMRSPLYQSYSIASFLVQTLQSPPFRESVDLIYKNIQLLHPASQLQSLMITSTLAGEGKSTLTLGLALSAARLHQRVLVIDADLRRPVLHRQLALPNDQGLSNLLETPSPSIRPQRLPILDFSIDILPAGPEPADPVKLLGSPRMQELMRLFQSRYDLILIDTPPILGTVDALQVASFCTGAVVVAQLDRVTQTELKQAISTLSRLNVLGLVANRSKRHLPYYDADPVEQNGRVPFPVN